MTTNTVKNNNASLPAGALVLLLVVGLGGVAFSWGVQLTQGMAVTGLNQQVVWGMYIAGFFVAIGSGASLLAMAVVSEFSDALLSLDYRKKAVLMALSCFAIGAVLITIDLGNPVNLWRILTAGRFSSFMTWDFFALLITGLLSVVYLAAGWKQSVSAKTTRTIGVIALISSVLLVVVESWMLAAMAAHPLWNGGLTVLSFLLMAFTAGVALAMVTWPELASKLSGWLKLSLWAGLAVVLAEVFTGLLESSIRPYPEIKLLISGSVSPMFWLYLVAGVIVPLAILVTQWKLNWSRVAAALALVGVLLEKLWLLSAGQAISWLDLSQTAYTPGWIEYLGIIGCAALGILIYQVLLRVLKVE